RDWPRGNGRRVRSVAVVAATPGRAQDFALHRGTRCEANRPIQERSAGGRPGAASEHRARVCRGRREWRALLRDAADRWAIADKFVGRAALDRAGIAWDDGAEI